MSQNVEERKKCNRELAAEDGCLNSAFTLNKWFVKVRPCYGIGSSEVGTNVHATSARTPSARYVRHESGNLVPDHAPNVKPPSSGSLSNQSKATANAVAILNSLPD